MTTATLTTGSTARLCLAIAAGRGTLPSRISRTAWTWRAEMSGPTSPISVSRQGQEQQRERQYTSTVVPINRSAPRGRSSSRSVPPAIGEIYAGRRSPYTHRRFEK